MHTNLVWVLDVQSYLQYATKIKSLPKHPAHNAVFNNKYINAIRTFGLRIKQFSTASNIDFSDILETPSYFILPPWCVKPPKIVLDLVHLKKDRTDASIYQQLFLEIRDKYRDYIPIYTDGSRDGNSVACATVFPSDTELSMRLPDSASIFTAEIWAIITALEEIKNASESKVGVPYNDFKHCINQYIFSTWQDDWNGAVMNKLHSVKPVLGDWQSSYRRCRRDEVVLCRARIGHTNLTHSYILKKDPPPQCEHCQCILTVRHILVECNHLAQTRNDIFGRCGVVESFQFHPELI